jgi:excisionase family DNA binding protein
MPTREIMDMSETCSFLNLTEKTVRKLIAAHQLPGVRRFGAQWRFSRAALLAAFQKEGGRGNGATERKTAGQRT